LLLLSCAPKPVVQQVTPQEKAKLEGLRSTADEVRTRLGKADLDTRKTCELRVGECMLDYQDERDALVQGRSFQECEDVTERGEQASCEEQRVLERGEGDALNRYYDYYLSCFGGVASCIAKVEDQRDAAALAELIETRRSSFLSSEFARELVLKRATADAQLQYARTTLPPAGDSVCQGLPEVKQCERRSAEARAALDEYLVLPPKDYDEQEAKARLEAANQAGLDCVTIEQDCVIDALGQYGATARTRDLLQENFELLATRQKLQEGRGPAASDQCLQQGQEEHAAYIIANYGQYARQPVEYFRVQMHRAFTKVHQAQIRCMRELPNGDGSPTVASR
jgi:hypothetical protein